MAQSAIRFCLTQPTIVSVLPNLTTLDELTEYAGSAEVASITDEELEKLDELWREGFYIEEPTAVGGED